MPKAPKKNFLQVTLELGLWGDKHLVTPPPPGGGTGLTLGGGDSKGGRGYPSSPKTAVGEASAGTLQEFPPERHDSLAIRVV